jgi:hypothetical protein
VAAILDEATRKLKTVSVDDLRLEHFLPTHLLPAATERTQHAPARVAELAVAGGHADGFLSHSWHDDPEEKLAKLRVWARAFRKTHGRAPRVFFDRLFIDQTDIARSLAFLPVWVAGCYLLVCLRGPTYTSRLWCGGARARARRYLGLSARAFASLRSRSLHNHRPACDRALCASRPPIHPPVRRRARRCLLEVYVHMVVGKGPGHMHVIEISKACPPPPPPPESALPTPLPIRAAAAQTRGEPSAQGERGLSRVRRPASVRISSRSAQCADESMRQMLLGIFEMGYGSLAAFDAALNVSLAQATVP